MSVYEVNRTGRGDVISWNRKRIFYRINRQHFSNRHRRIMRQVIENVAWRVGSGCSNEGRTTKKPMNGRAAYLAPGVTNLYVYAKLGFDTINGANNAALAFADKHSIGDEYKGAIIVVNATTFSDPEWGTPEAFRAIMAHEMGHVVGLEHPTDPSQLMSPHLTGLPWKAGDLQGFSVLRWAAL